MKRVRLAIVGAMGMVGRTTLDVLREWQVPVADLRLFGSGTSAVRHLQYNGRTIPVEPLVDVPGDVDVAIFATGADISREWAPRFSGSGVVVIDHSSYFRLDRDVPLVIPEINGEAARRHKGLISNPNCTASVALLPLAALEAGFGLERVIASSYQSVSGAGADGLEELERQLAGAPTPPKVHARVIAHNVIPQVGPMDDAGHCEEEKKFAAELSKILSREDLHVLVTTVRVPVRVGHALAVTVQLRQPSKLPEVEDALSRMPGIAYDPRRYHTPLEIAGRQEIYVSRLRAACDEGRWWQFWAVGDNLRKGAASNAVQILQLLFED